MESINNLGTFIEPKCNNIVIEKHATETRKNKTINTKLQDTVIAKPLHLKYQAETNKGAV